MEDRICTKCLILKPLSDYYAGNNCSSWCKICYNAKNKEWRRLNKEYDKARNSKWHKDNPEKARNRNNIWRKNNPSKIKAIKNARRAREVNAEGSFTAEEWNDLLKDCNHLCLRCGSDRNICIDHIISLANSGSNYISNLQPLCASCNSGKRSKSIDYRPQWIKSKYSFGK